MICKFEVWWFGLMISWTVSGKLICWICRTGQTDEQTNGWMDEQTNEQTSKRTWCAARGARRAMKAGVWSKQKTYERTNERTANAFNEHRQIVLIVLIVLTLNCDWFDREFSLENICWICPGIVQPKLWQFWQQKVQGKVQFRPLKSLHSSQLGKTFWSLNRPELHC